jgi:hypothetical protein
MSAPIDSSQQDAIRKYASVLRNQQSSRRGAGGGCLGNVVRLVGILVLAVIFIAAFDYVDAPWSWGLFGKPTLTGEWVGTFKLPQGQIGAAYLNLTHDHNPTYDTRHTYSIHNLPPFGGNGQGCIGTSGVQAYLIDGGSAANGLDVEMTLQAQKPTVPNYALHELKGAWAGDSLTLAGTFTTILDTKGSTLLKSESNQTQPTTIKFHRGDQADFENACQTLGQ